MKNLDTRWTPKARNKAPTPPSVEVSGALGEFIQETLDERLEGRIKKREESGDFRVCAAHDLAPIFEKAFDIKVKDLEQNAHFVDMVEEKGLVLPNGLEEAGLARTKSLQLKRGLGNRKTR